MTAEVVLNVCRLEPIPRLNPRSDVLTKRLAIQRSCLILTPRLTPILVSFLNTVLVFALPESVEKVAYFVEHALLLAINGCNLLLQDEVRLNQRLGRLACRHGSPFTVLVINMLVLFVIFVWSRFHSLLILIE